MRDDDGARARVGMVLNEKWALEKLIGVGGMGAVYAARHTRNAARAAVKVLHPEFARIHEVRERFLREGRAANTVEHPGAVRVIDDDQVKSGPDEGTTYLVMDLLEGASLEDRLEDGPPLDEREVLAMMDAVLDVLAAAHARGVVHRDLKPENLLLGKDSTGGGARWMVLDFGLARLIHSAAITERGKTLGTPAYMSPEQAAGRHHEVDGRTDLFALAATAFRVLSGRRVHEAPSPLAVVLAMASTPAPALHDVAPSVSAGTARVIDRALSFKREDRYPDAAAMRAEVQQAAATLDAAASRAKVDVEAPTVLSMRAPPIPPSAEPTVELSARDLEPADAAKPPPPSIPIGAASEVRSPAGHDTDRPKRRRSSFIPVITALFLGGLVVKLAMDADARRRAGDAGGETSVDAGAPSRGVGPAYTVLGREPRDAQPEASAVDAGASADATARDDETEDGGEGDDGEADGPSAPDAGDGVAFELDAASLLPVRTRTEVVERSATPAAPRPVNEGHHASSPGHGGPSAPPGHKPKHGKPRPKHD